MMKRILLTLAALILVASSAFASELNDYWLDFGVGSHLPRPELESGLLDYDQNAKNTEKQLSCKIINAIEDDFQKYIAKLKEYGFTTVMEAGFNSYYAYHTSTEYTVSVTYYKKSGTMEITSWSNVEDTVYDILKYLFNTYKPELLCEVPNQLFNELIRFGYQPVEIESINE